MNTDLMRSRRNKIALASLSQEDFMVSKPIKRPEKLDILRLSTISSDDKSALFPNDDLNGIFNSISLKPLSLFDSSNMDQSPILAMSPSAS